MICISKSDPFRTQICMMAVLCIVLLFATGCQTFRTSKSDVDKQRDARVGAMIESVGSTTYWLAEMIGWIYPLVGWDIHIDEGRASRSAAELTPSECE